jgi:hypothetical protein
MLEYTLWYLAGGLVSMTLAVLRDGSYWDPSCDVGEAVLYIFFWPFILLVVTMMFLASAVADSLRFLWRNTPEGP